MERVTKQTVSTQQTCELNSVVSSTTLLISAWNPDELLGGKYLGLPLSPFPTDPLASSSNPDNIGESSTGNSFSGESPGARDAEI